MSAREVTSGSASVNSATDHGETETGASARSDVLLAGVSYIVLASGAVLSNSWLMHPGRFPYALHLATWDMFLSSVVWGLVFAVRPQTFPWLFHRSREMARTVGSAETENSGGNENVSSGSSNSQSNRLRKLLDGLLQADRKKQLCFGGGAALFAVSVVASNAAYEYCSVAFTQMLKESSPALAYLMLWMHGIERFNGIQLLMVAGSVCGAFLTVKGELRFSPTGFALLSVNIVSQLYLQLLTQMVFSPEKKPKGNADSAASSGVSGSGSGMSGTDSPRHIGVHTVSHSEGGEVITRASTKSTAVVEGAAVARGDLLVMLEVEGHAEDVVTETTRLVDETGSNGETTHVSQGGTGNIGETVQSRALQTSDAPPMDSLSYVLVMSPATLVVLAVFVCIQYFSQGSHQLSQVVHAAFGDQALWKVLLANGALIIVMNVAKTRLLAVGGVMSNQMCALPKDLVVIAYGCLERHEVLTHLQILGSGIIMCCVMSFIYLRSRATTEGANTRLSVGAGREKMSWGRKENRCSV